MEIKKQTTTLHKVVGQTNQYEQAKCSCGEYHDYQNILQHIAEGNKEIFEENLGDFEDWLFDNDYASRGEWDMYDADGMMTTPEAMWDVYAEEFLQEKYGN